MLNEERTAYYIDNFFGYGNWDSDFWFVGMEEGGGNVLNLVRNKVDAFFNDGESHLALVDNYDFQVNKVGSPWNNEALRFLGPRPNNQPVSLQNYWSKKIKILLGVNNLPINNESIRQYQSNHWGRIHPEQYSLKHAVIELMPLPSPGTGLWYYTNWTSHFTGNHCPPLATRQHYYSLTRTRRVNMFKNKVNELKPKLVVLSGAGHDNEYNAIAGTHNWRTKIFDNFSCHFFHNDSTLFVKTMAPNTRGLTNTYWEEVTFEIRNTI